PDRQAIRRLGRSVLPGPDIAWHAAHLRGVRRVQVVTSGPMLRALILLHRWLGISFCLLFAMWFATGMVMHFVPFPALTEAERIDGLMPIDPSLFLRAPTHPVDS